MALPIYTDDDIPYYFTPLGELPPPPPRTPQNPQTPQPTTSPVAPSSGSYPWTATQNEETQTTDPSKSSYNQRDKNIELQTSNWYDYLQMKAKEFEAQYGWNPYHDSDLQGVIRNMSYEGNQYTDTQLLDNVLQNWQQRNSNTPGAGGGGSSSGGGGGGSNGYSGPFAAPQPGAGWMPTYTAPVFQPPAPLNIPTWNAPAPFAYDPFAPPTLDQARNEPGFAFAMEQGGRALENSAASKGLLRTGGTLKELIGFGQRLGEQNYGNVYNRMQGTYGVNRNNAADIYTKNYNAARDTYGAGVDEITGEYNSLYKTAQDAFTNATTGARDEYAPRRAEAEANFKRDMDIWLEKMRIAGLIEQDSE